MPEKDNKNRTRMEILEKVNQNPEIKQKDLANKLGVGVGTVNWHIKRLANKGFLKMRRMSQWQWKYILTPKGVKEKARLTKNYVKNSMELYRKTRKKSKELLDELESAGHDTVRIKGENDLVEVCKLTCCARDVKVKNDTKEDGRLPLIKVKGKDLELTMPEERDEL